jgi:hypothetical protein
MDIDEDALFMKMKDQEREIVQGRYENQMNQAMMMDEKKDNIIKEQLDLSEELRKIENLLRGKIQYSDDNGELKWKDPATKDDVVLSEAGINLVLNTIQWYLNKNTLLSNYDEDMIFAKMEDFSISLADALFMNYEKYFLYPTPEECHQGLLERLERKKQEVLYNAEMKGIKLNPDDVMNKLISEIEPTRERIKIKEQKIKNKLKGFDLIMREVQDVVHSAYLRALFGAERRTLRQHIHVSEQVNQPMNIKQGKNPNDPWYKKW